MPDARFHEPRWSWESKDNDTRVGYMGMDGRVSLAGLIAHMEKVAPGARLDDIMVNYSTAKWTRSATAEELAERAAWNAKQEQRQEEWERKALARLLEKYGPQPTDPAVTS